MKKTIVLPTLRYDGSQTQDTQIRVGLINDHDILKNNDRDIVLNLSQQFYDEKNICTKYKIFGKVRMVFRNMYSGTTDYLYLKEKLALINNPTNWQGYLPYDEYAFIRKDVVRDKVITPQINNLNTFEGLDVISSGDIRHKVISTIDSPYYNWNLHLSYVNGQDGNYPMKYTLSGDTQEHISFVSGDGIIFRVQENDYNYILTSPVKHGINVGEYVIINGSSYYINSVGNEIYNSEKYVITISKMQIPNGISFNNLVTGKRCSDIKNSGTTTSQYYVHKHKVLTDYNDYNIDNIGFESPIFEEERKMVYEDSSGNNDVVIDRNRMESLLYEFKKPFILSGLTNNLGFTPNEIFLTTVFKNSNGIFNYPPKVGYSFNFHNSWSDLYFSGNTSNESSLTSSEFNGYGNYSGVTLECGNSLSKGNVLYGSFIEYIPNEMKERVISETYHKIIINPSVFNHDQTDSNVYYGASNDNPVGLYYQTHYNIKLKELSPYVETSNSSNILNLPDNAKYHSDDKLWKWRDVYDLGYFDVDGNGVDFTYMNDTLYVHKDINFYLRNEKSYTNKLDGVFKFKNMNTDVNC